MRTLEKPPLEFTTASGKVTGIVVDIIREAARRTGRQVDIQVYPWKRVINEVAAGNADAAFNAGKSQERMVWGHFHSIVLIDETFVLFARHPILLSSTLNEAPDLRVGTQLGYYYGEKFDRILKRHPSSRSRKCPLLSTTCAY